MATTAPIVTAAPPVPTAKQAGAGESSAPTTALTAPPPTTGPATNVQKLATARITDPIGDATPSVLDKSPSWADLAGATLARSDKGFELRVKLAGGTAPRSTDSDHTMNVASFYDIDGDGSIDYEVWANLSDTGWGGSWFDDRNHTSRYGTDAGVTWTPEGDEIVMRFDAAHVGNAPQFRWSVASEWGRYEALSTPASVRDDAPDNDRPATFSD